MMSLRLNAGSQHWPPQFNTFVNDTLLQLCPHNDEALLLNLKYFVAKLFEKQRTNLYYNWLRVIEDI